MNFFKFSDYILFQSAYCVTKFVFLKAVYSSEITYHGDSVARKASLTINVVYFSTFVLCQHCKRRRTPVPNFISHHPLHVIWTDYAHLHLFKHYYSHYFSSGFCLYRCQASVVFHLFGSSILPCLFHFMFVFLHPHSAVVFTSAL